MAPTQNPYWNNKDYGSWDKSYEDYPDWVWLMNPDTKMYSAWKKI